MSEKSYKLLIKISNNSYFSPVFVALAHLLAALAVLMAEFSKPITPLLLLAILASCLYWVRSFMRQNRTPEYVSLLGCEGCRYRYPGADWQSGQVTRASRIFGMVLLKIRPERGGSPQLLLLSRAMIGDHQLRQLKIWLRAC